ncbi:hypothetical protein SOCE26_006670 [Sorangium cellulosum]|uniref:Uncharacterized protein n=1 Tax=Sorangium cellulosum TaxID=56 RepID=A0A2L0EJ07_SORCE|nr:hypothetical protein [Sorangium cellulosum]AUX39283.1 hypothetical protein SOCE26_006670 [Sorangium cellulosum]
MTCSGAGRGPRGARRAAGDRAASRAPALRRAARRSAGARWLAIGLLAGLGLGARPSGAQQGPGAAGSGPPAKEADDADAQRALGTPAALPTRAASVTLDKTLVQLTVSFRDVVDGEISKKLLSGLPTVITMRGYLFSESGGDPVALTAKSCRIVYDLWDEVFRIQLFQAGGQSSTVAVNVEGVLRNCAEARKMPLVERSLVREGSRYFVAVLVEVNPMSAEMLDRIKRWVTRPPGSTAIGPGDSLFGSFVGLFVTRIGNADRKLAFRTPSFLPPAPPPPSPPPPSPTAAPPPGRPGR